MGNAVAMQIVKAMKEVCCIAPKKPAGATGLQYSFCLKVDTAWIKPGSLNGRAVSRVRSGGR